MNSCFISEKSAKKTIVIRVIADIRCMHFTSYLETINMHYCNICWVVSEGHVYWFCITLETNVLGQQCHGRFTLLLSDVLWNRYIPVDWLIQKSQYSSWLTDSGIVTIVIESSIPKSNSANNVCHSKIMLSVFESFLHPSLLWVMCTKYLIDKLW